MTEGSRVQPAAPVRRHLARQGADLSGAMDDVAARQAGVWIAASVRRIRRIMETRGCEAPADHGAVYEELDWIERLAEHLAPSPPAEGRSLTRPLGADLPPAVPGR